MVMSKLNKENKKILEMALKERNLYYMVIAGATACMFLSIFISSQLPPPEELPCDCTDYEINTEFLQQIQKMRKPSEVSRSTLERVVLTRKVRNDIKEMWNALQFELDNLLNHGEVDDALIRLKDRHMALMIEIEDLLKFDESWQNSLSKSLSSYVQNEFKSLQNPPNCNTTSPQMFIKLIGCGLGCEVHNIMTKFLVALGQGRTLFCYTRLISYELNDGFETRFEPLSENCRKPKAKANWQPLKDDELSKNETHVYIKQSYGYNTKFKAQGVPSKLLPTIEAFHSHPFLWFAGQIVSYITRPNAITLKSLRKMEEEINFEIPIVGIHVRRSDKIISAEEGTTFHNLSEFIKPAEDWFQKYQMRLIRGGSNIVVKKRIYLATDDPMAWEEAKSFPEFEFFGNKSFSKRSNRVETRRDAEGFFETIIDVTMLSKCNYIVGTLSSELSRLAYELIQTYHLDATDKFYSLDATYAIDDQLKNDYVAMFHQPRNNMLGEMEVRVGDTVECKAASYLSPNIFGVNKLTNETGFVSTHRLKRLNIALDYPGFFNNFGDTITALSR